MYKKLFSSNTFLLALAIVMIEAYLKLTGSDTVFYGLNPNSKLTNFLLFAPQDISPSYGLSFIFSFFHHSTAMHTLGNVVMLFIVGLLVESQIGRIKQIAVIALSHLLSLALVVFNMQFIHTFEKVYLSGASLGVVGLLSYYLVINKKWFNFTILGAITGYLAITHKGPVFDPHLYAYIIGTLLTLIFKKK
jgi:membrane associated rhomboid family serine protease